MNTIEREILNLITDENGNLIHQRATKEYLEKRGYLEYLLKRYKDNTTDSLSEILYRIENGIENVPTCKVCGGKLKFNVWNRCYPTYCSNACKNKDPEVLKKNSEGVSAGLKKAYAERKEDILRKRSETFKNKTGEDNNGSAFSCKSVQDKVKKKFMEKYGRECYILNDDDKKKALEGSNLKRKQKWAERGLDVDYVSNGMILVRNGCSVHGDIELPVSVFNNRTKPGRLGKTVLCPICNPVKTNTNKQ